MSWAMPGPELAGLPALAWRSRLQIGLLVGVDRNGWGCNLGCKHSLLFVRVGWPHSQ